MRCICFPKTHDDEMDSVEMRKANDWEKPADWPYMEQSGEVLRNLPDTWKQYPATREGAVKIIEMEFNELMKATTDEDAMHECVHLGAATLYFWRMLANVK